jgi:hypothetical protein
LDSLAGKYHPLRASLLLKHPTVLILAAVICVALQIWVSYLSALFILDGDLILGLSIFLVVPALGLLLVSYFLWFRRHKMGNPSIGPND